LFVFSGTGAVRDSDDDGEVCISGFAVDGENVGVSPEYRSYSLNAT